MPSHRGHRALRHPDVAKQQSSFLPVDRKSVGGIPAREHSHALGIDIAASQGEPVAVGLGYGHGARHFHEAVRLDLRDDRMEHVPDQKGCCMGGKVGGQALRSQLLHRCFQSPQLIGQQHIQHAAELECRPRGT